MTKKGEKKEVPDCTETIGFGYTAKYCEVCKKNTLHGFTDEAKLVCIKCCTTKI